MTLIVLYIALGAAAIIVGGIALVSMMQRRELLLRATEEYGAEAVSRVLRPEKPYEGKLRARLEEMAKQREQNTEVQGKLVQSGFDSATAPAVFFLLRVTSLVAVPLLGVVITPRANPVIYLAGLGLAVFIGFVMPLAVLDRFLRVRQERIRKSVPDALDLLVVCVEAGISLDAAILRVARELRLTHPDLAHELAVVNRLTNAGMPRETALRGLWQRTGVPELRALVSSMIQSEKWGTSIATVLRVSSESMRRKRRQAAERKAKMAALKMTFPLLLFILPALFVVILGPAVVQIIREFSKV
jgi:tight adherence protein C